jgi:hypothetical protein
MTQAPAVTVAPSVVTGWRPVPGQESVLGTTFDAVIWTGTRFLASGSVPDGGGVILDSVDGQTWRQQPLSGPGAASVSLAAGPAGIVAVGGHDAEHLGSWFSADGLKFTARVDAFGRPSGTNTLTVTGVVATTGGWVAVGREDPACNHNCGLDPVRARVWTSTNGLDWAPVDGEAALAGGAITDVTSTGSGFVAVGSRGTRAAVWTSADGSTWRSAPDAAVLHPRPGADPALWTQMTSVAVSHGILVAVGTDGNGGAHGPTARAWWSTDGLAWTEATGERFEGFTSGQDAAVTGTRDGFIAAYPVGDPTCSSGLWQSGDGSAWQCASSDPAFAHFRPSDVAESPTTQVVVGLTTTDVVLDAPPGAVWWRALP